MPNQLSKLGTAGLSAVAAGAINGDAVTGIIALGSTQATATAINAANNAVATTAASTGVLLPPGNAGDEIVVFNGGANALSVYPPVGATINGAAVNVAVSVPTLKPVYLIYFSATQLCAVISA